MASNRPGTLLLVEDEHRLRDLVWSPILPGLGGAREVLVSPDGFLCSLPWPALPGRRPDGYLIEEFSFAVIPSARMISPMRSTALRANAGTSSQ